MEADEILRGRSQLNRRLYQQRIADAAEAQQEQSQPTSYLNFDASAGLSRLQSTDGNIIYGAAQTNGAVGKGENIRLRRGNVLAKYDEMPRRKQPTAIPQIKKDTLGFIVWNTGFTIGGYANRAVDFFSGIYNRNDPKWKMRTSNADTMPNIKGLKLIYIPMIYRSLSSQELIRLKRFQSNGGITFITGEYASFSQERQKANELMMALDSPLRCVDDPSIYYNPNGNYPANFQKTSILYGNCACKIIGGQSISTIPESTFTPGTNVVWIAYDSDSKTILSGDVDWAGSFTPVTGNDNAKFAKSLLKIKW